MVAVDRVLLLLPARVLFCADTAPAARIRAAGVDRNLAEYRRLHRPARAVLRPLLRVEPLRCRPSRLYPVRAWWADLFLSAGRQATYRIIFALVCRRLVGRGSRGRKKYVFQRHIRAFPGRGDD